MLCHWEAEKEKREQQKGGEQRAEGTECGLAAKASQERPLQRRNRVHPTEKLTLDTMALASSTVFFKTCFIFSFGAIREKRTDSCQTHGLFQNPGCSGTLLPEPGNLRCEYESGLTKGTQMWEARRNPQQGERSAAAFTQFGDSYKARPEETPRGQRQRREQENSRPLRGHSCDSTLSQWLKRRQRQYVAGMAQSNKTVCMYARMFVLSQGLSLFPDRTACPNLLALSS